MLLKCLTQGGGYGLDYMDGVSLDQVMLTNHRDIQRVDLMKMDVETFEIQVFNGSMQSLFNVIVEHIVVEVYHLKSQYNMMIPFNFYPLQKTLVRMGYEILNLSDQITLTDMQLPDFATDITFNIHDLTQSPANRLSRGICNPFQKLDMFVQDGQHQ